MASDNTLEGAVRRIVRNELDKKLPAQLSEAVRAEVLALVGQRLAIVDRLIQALQDAPVVQLAPASRRPTTPTGGQQKVPAKSPHKAAARSQAAAKRVTPTQTPVKAAPAKPGGAASAARFVQGARVRYKQGLGTLPATVLRVDPKKKVVTLRNDKGVEYVRGFDKVYG